MADHDLREVLEDLGTIEVDIDEGDIITDLIVLLRVQKLDDTDDLLVIGSTNNTGGIVCTGMLHAAVLQHNLWMTEGDE